MSELTLNIEGMMCEHCAARVTKSLTAVEGVAQAEVSLEGKCARVSYDPAKTGEAQLRAAVTEAGYEVK